MKLFLGRPLERAKPLKFLWKVFPELSDASGRQPRGTKERPGTPPVHFKGSHGQPKRAQRRPKTVHVAAEMPKESYQNAVCNAFSQSCASEWRFKRFSEEFAAISRSPDPYDSMTGTAYPALLRFSVFPATRSAKSPLFNRILDKITGKYNRTENGCTANKIAKVGGKTADLTEDSCKKPRSGPKSAAQASPRAPHCITHVPPESPRRVRRLLLLSGF